MLFSHHKQIWLLRMSVLVGCSHLQSLPLVLVVLFRPQEDIRSLFPGLALFDQ